MTVENISMINLHERMLPTSAGVEPLTSWSHCRELGYNMMTSWCFTSLSKLKSYWDNEGVIMKVPSMKPHTVINWIQSLTLRKHAYSNILKILPPKNENFQIKNSYILHISDQNIDCGYSLEPPRWGGSNEYPQSMFLSRNKKNNVYPCKPQFYYIKVGFKGVKII